MHKLIVIAGLFCFNLYAQNDTTIPQIVDNQCMNCHGDATLMQAPMISGQKKDFLEFELFNFRDYVRDHEIMNQVMEDFSDQEVKEMAAYISGLSLCDSQGPLDPLPGANIKNGKEIFSRSCIGCHKKDTSGIGPVIFGQKSIYTMDAIRSFQSTWYEPRPSRVNMRSHTDMLSEQDIRDVATFLNAQKLCE